MGFSRQEYWSGLPFPSPLDTSSTSQIITAKNANGHWTSPRRQKLLLVENHCPGHHGIEKTIFPGPFLNSSPIETMRKTLSVIIVVSSHKVLGWSVMWQETPWLSPLRCLWPYKDTDALSSAAWERGSFCTDWNKGMLSLWALSFLDLCPAQRQGIPVSITEQVPGYFRVRQNRDRMQPLTWCDLSFWS